MCCHLLSSATFSQLCLCCHFPPPTITFSSCPLLAFFLLLSPPASLPSMLLIPSFLVLRLPCVTFLTPLKFVLFSWGMSRQSWQVAADNQLVNLQLSLFWVPVYVCTFLHLPPPVCVCLFFNTFTNCFSVRFMQVPFSGCHCITSLDLSGCCSVGGFGVSIGIKIDSR